jgi:Na+-translocating ferredoxin:NAD+ oxidoreductase RnfC subunit
VEEHGRGSSADVGSDSGRRRRCRNKGFPTYKKLDSGERIISNGAECEPLSPKTAKRCGKTARKCSPASRLCRNHRRPHVTLAVKRKNEDVVAAYRPEASRRGYNILVW